MLDFLEPAAANMDNFYKALLLMGKGMAGIFIVMLLVLAVVAVLNKVTKNK